VTGELIVSAPGTVPTGVAFEASAAKDPPWWVYAVLFGSLVLAAGLVFARWQWRGVTCELGTRLGPVDWDFSKSWGSTLTVVGALLGTIIAAGVLPDEPVVPKATYAGLNLFFGALIVVAPFIYTATQRAKEVHRTKTVKVPQFQGYVWSFLLATSLTLWAVLGELGTMFAVLEEIRVGQTMPGLAIWVFGALMALSGVVLLVLAWTRIKTILKYQSDLTNQRRRQQECHRELLSELAVTEEEATDGKKLLEPELPSWSVL
jgi:hypothetical protein